MASRKNFPGNVERKQKDALERQAEYAKLTNEQKLERLDRANLTATRERYRLNMRITKAAEAAAVAAAEAAQTKSAPKKSKQ